MEKTNANRKKKGGGFQSMGLSSAVFSAIMAKGYNLPTPIQRKAIPKIMAGQNLVATSRTGSGKTVAFLIPLIEKLISHSTIVGARGVILSPTRELAIQTAAFCKELMKRTDLTIGKIVGGVALEEQFEVLAQNPDIIIATPGRLLHHVRETKYSLKRVEMAIIDEADRMFEMNFAADIRALFEFMPQEKQVVMMSATIPKELQEFTSTGARDFLFLQLDKENKISDKLMLHFLLTRPIEKYAALIYLLKKIVKKNEQTLVFVSTKYHVQYLDLLLPKFGVNAVGIYGDQDTTLRNMNFTKFIKHQCNVLVVTDLAARGLDIPLLDNVVHFDFPPTPKNFVHRTGRTARAGKSGTCYCLLTSDELPYMYDMCTHVGRRLVREAEQVNNPEYGYYGCFPTNLLSEEYQEIMEFHSRDEEL